MAAWQALANTPIVGHYWRVATYNGKIYLTLPWSDDVGNAAPNLYEYDPVANTYTAKTPCPDPYTYGSDAVWNGVWYHFGGWKTGPSTITNRCLAYDFATDTWSSIAPLPVAEHDSAAAVAVAGKIYVIGGYEYDETTSLAYAYDVATDTWDTLAAMPERGSHTERDLGYLQVVTDGAAIYTIGGQRYDSGWTSNADLLKYTIATDTWEIFSNIGIGVDGAGAAVVDGYAYVIAGYNTDEGTYPTNVQAWHMASNVGYHDTDYPVGLWGVTATVLNDVIYVFGGAGGPPGYLDDDLAYSLVPDPQPGWGPGAPGAPTINVPAAGDLEVEYGTDADTVEISWAPAGTQWEAQRLFGTEVVESAEGTVQTSHYFDFIPTERTETWRVRIFDAGFWSPWATVTVNIVPVESTTECLTYSGTIKSKSWSSTPAVLGDFAVSADDRYIEVDMWYSISNSSSNPQGARWSWQFAPLSTGVFAEFGVQLGYLYDASNTLSASGHDYQMLGFIPLVFDEPGVVRILWNPTQADSTVYTNQYSFCPVVPTRPTNDLRERAISLTGTTGEATVDLLAATVEEGENLKGAPDSSFYDIDTDLFDRTVWYKWDASERQMLHLNMNDFGGSSFGSNIAHAVAYDSANRMWSWFDGENTLVVESPTGGTYWIQIGLDLLDPTDYMWGIDSFDARSDDPTNFAFTWEVFTLPDSPGHFSDCVGVDWGTWGEYLQNFEWFLEDGTSVEHVPVGIHANNAVYYDPPVPYPSTLVEQPFAQYSGYPNPGFVHNGVLYVPIAEDTSDDASGEWRWHIAVYENGLSSPPNKERFAAALQAAVDYVPGAAWVNEVYGMVCLGETAHIVVGVGSSGDWVMIFADVNTGQVTKLTTNPYPVFSPDWTDAPYAKVDEFRWIGAAAQGAGFPVHDIREIDTPEGEPLLTQIWGSTEGSGVTDHGTIVTHLGGSYSFFGQQLWVANENNYAIGQQRMWDMPHSRENFDGRGGNNGTDSPLGFGPYEVSTANASKLLTDTSWREFYRWRQQSMDGAAVDVWRVLNGPNNQAHILSVPPAVGGTSAGAIVYHESLNHNNVGIRLTYATVLAIGTSGIIFRRVDANNYWKLQCGATLTLSIVVDGVESVVQTVATGGTSGFYWVKAYGSTIKCYTAGVGAQTYYDFGYVYISVVDGRHRNGTGHGFWAASTNTYIDSYEVGTMWPMSTYAIEWENWESGNATVKRWVPMSLLAATEGRGHYGDGTIDVESQEIVEVWDRSPLPRYPSSGDTWSYAPSFTKGNSVYQVRWWGAYPGWAFPFPGDVAMGLEAETVAWPEIEPFSVYGFNLDTLEWLGEVGRYEGPITGYGLSPYGGGNPQLMNYFIPGSSTSTPTASLQGTTVRLSRQPRKRLEGSISGPSPTEWVGKTEESLLPWGDTVTTRPHGPKLSTPPQQTQQTITFLASGTLRPSSSAEQTVESDGTITTWSILLGDDIALTARLLVNGSTVSELSLTSSRTAEGAVDVEVSANDEITVQLAAVDLATTTFQATVVVES